MGQIKPKTISRYCPFKMGENEIYAQLVASVVWSEIRNICIACKQYNEAYGEKYINSIKHETHTHPYNINSENYEK